jgi:hypothetical protein
MTGAPAFLRNVRVLAGLSDMNCDEPTAGLTIWALRT